MVKNLLVLIISILLSLILCEFILTFVSPNPRKKTFIWYEKWNKDASNVRLPKRNFVAKGNYGESIRTNSLGCRENRDYSPLKQKDTIRLLGIGDSYTFGAGVALGKTFLKILESQLNKGSRNYRYEVINGGVVGFDTLDELNYLKIIGPILKPDLVILQFFGNDLISVKTPYLDTKGNYLVFAHLPYQLFPNLSYFFRARIRLLANYLQKKMRGRGRDLTPPFLSDQEYFLSNWRALVLPPRELEKEWRRVKEAIKEMNHWCKRNKAEFLLLLIPYADQVEKAFSLDLYQNFGVKINEDLARKDWPQKELKNFARENNIHYLDLLPIFRKEPRKKLLYINKDYHLSKYGHLVTAKTLTQVLDQQKGLFFGLGQ